MKSPETVGFGCRSSSTSWKTMTTSRTSGTTGKSNNIFNFFHNFVLLLENSKHFGC